MPRAFRRAPLSPLPSLPERDSIERDFPFWLSGPLRGTPLNICLKKTSVSCDTVPISRTHSSFALWSEGAIRCLSSFPKSKLLGYMKSAHFDPENTIYTCSAWYSPGSRDEFVLQKCNDKFASLVIRFHCFRRRPFSCYWGRQIFLLRIIWESNSCRKTFQHDLGP
jgi:hypothetical protein